MTRSRFMIVNVAGFPCAPDGSVTGRGAPRSRNDTANFMVRRRARITRQTRGITLGRSITRDDRPLSRRIRGQCGSVPATRGSTNTPVGGNTFMVTK
jgi:hypothetical protein